MSLVKIIPPVIKPNTEISVTVSKNKNITEKFYSNGNIVYYSKDTGLWNAKEFFQLDPLQSSASVTALVNVTIPGTKRDVLFIGDSHGKLTIAELLLDLEQKFNVLKEIQVFNAPISEIVVDNTGTKVFITGAVNMNSNSAGAAKTGDTLLRFLNWELGNSIGDPMGLNGSAAALTFASGVKGVADFRVTVADTQGTLLFYSGSDSGTGYKFVKTFKDTNSSHRGVIKDVKYSPSSNEDVENILSTYGAYQRSKQGLPVRGKYLVACYSDKRVKLFDGDSGEFLLDVVNDEELERLSTIRGGWSLVEWLSSDVFIVSGKCGSRIYKVNDGKSCEMLHSSHNLQLHGLCIKDTNLVGVQEDGALVSMQLSESYDGVTECHKITGIHKPIDYFSTDLVSTIDGQVYDFKKQTLYNNDDNAQLVLIAKLGENAYISLNKLGKLTEFFTENGTKHVSKTIELNKQILIAEVDVLKKIITFVDYDFNVGTIDLNTDEVTSISINGKNDEITAVQNKNGKIFIATFNQQKQEASILTTDEVVLTHKTKISKFLIDEGFVTFSDFSGKTQIQSLKDDLEIQGKHFNKGDIVVSVNKWSHHSGKITSMVWRPLSIQNLSLDDSEPLLATVGLDNSIIVYSLKKTIRPKLKLENCHKMGIVGVLWNDDDELVTFGLDGCIKYWKV